ncbi:hypothetical protein [Streptomyces gobiensis]|uniref:hypothetical protein n=1 Tax=Streptomyces gobiensis TaxID=2875706 RepID=UPI001E476553|nr:hypothetical protein [Streptomyces gobiensis]UGY90315.1 hypothetical protein test1122_00285 [Streptomyces gobiensis]
MVRRPLAQGRDIACTLADNVVDVLYPLIVVIRGLGRLAGAGQRWWVRTPRERRGPALFLGAASALVVGLMPHGPLLAGGGLLAVAAWHGRGPRQGEPAEERAARLQAVYEALVPYFSLAEDTSPYPLYAHDGSWERVFLAYEFTSSGRLGRLLLRYPAYFRDGEPEARMRIQQVLCAKVGRGREYRFEWDEEENELEVTALPPLPTDICAQRFVAAPGEMVLGFTDSDAVQRTVPVADGVESRDVPPVVWRTGPRSTEPHLLALGQPGSGTTTLLRSVALQALQHGDVLVIDGSGTGEYTCLAGRRGVLSVESTLVGALASLEWAAHETERRLLAANRARQGGRPAPEDIDRPLWVLVDRPAVLSHLALTEGRPDPQKLLQVALRHGRAARVTVALADQFEGADGLGQAIRAYTRARVVLGPATPDQARAVLGEPPHTTPLQQMPPGRGYARLGSGPVHRLQVPVTPDPYDDSASEAHRAAVLALLPERPVPVRE